MFTGNKFLDVKSEINKSERVGSEMQDIVITHWVNSTSFFVFIMGKQLCWSISLVWICASF